ncbi:DinB superfamily protein [Bhargavaea ginsengi]|uniref:DinB superfamily protein n=2 Tax=Bhargavaea ginsengi TaxID=426757 RepID=A0A1H7BE68_9BACL|nr:DinB family protein [Bhargavaea ginsengi]SEJ71725.1 DinB superfamily protein [Bhargavaea ginsengi]
MKLGDWNLMGEEEWEMGPDRETEKIIREFGAYSDWLFELKSVDPHVLKKPLAEGKWSASEIIAHILKWDEHLSDRVIPAVLEGEGMAFPEFGPFNNRAAAYAEKVTPGRLITEAGAARNQLVSRLFELPESVLVRPAASNGDSHCPYTGSPYTLIYIIGDFIYHDQHHRQQIDDFLGNAQKHPIR